MRGSARAASALAGLRRLALIAALSWLAGCASFESDVYLAPVYGRYSRAGGGTETELFAGAIRSRRDAPGGRRTHWAARPLISQYRESNGDYVTRFVVPLGSVTRKGTDHVNQLLPIWRYQSTVDEHGRVGWKLLALPGIFWSHEPDGRIVRAFFPFGGVVEDFATFDRIVFVLFPLFLKTERAGRSSWNFLFPVFNYTHGAGGSAYRFWPLYGRNRYEGRYDRWFFLWPFFHRHRNDLGKPPEGRESRWMLWPLLGYSRRGTFEAWTVLWPFFGYARDPKTGYWAWDGPWPLVRVHKGGKNPPSEERKRFWPLWSRYRGDGLESTSFLWPLIRFNRETYPDGVREAEFVLPFWQRWEKRAHDGGVTRWEKLWPIYQYSDTLEHGERFAFPALNPLWNLPVIDDHYAWIYELWLYERVGAVSHERMWGGIYRREKDEFEDRSYALGFWSRRRYVEKGVELEEHAALFGLLRWRTRAGGDTTMLKPALPGPGWPLERSRERLPPPTTTTEERGQP